MSIPSALKRHVIVRAKGRCEYCGLAQAGQEAAFHIDHVTPVVAGGATVPDNLALACVSCSLRKGARSTAIDPGTREKANLFHPRRQRWEEHFVWRGCHLHGITNTGRATVAALRLNRTLIVEIRAEEAILGRHPPP